MQTEPFYGRAIAILKREKVPILLGGSFAMFHYAGVERESPDLDVFLRQEDLPCALRVLSAEGFRGGLADPLWLARVFPIIGRGSLDLIFSSGNGLGPVDDSWFEHAILGQFNGQSVRVVPVEEMLVSKAFLMARHRYDGADVAHLLLAQAEKMDWTRLLERFGTHWPVLLSHLVLFGYIYPAERHRIPPGVVLSLVERLNWQGLEAAAAKVCNGGYLDPHGFEVDQHAWGYHAFTRLA